MEETIRISSVDQIDWSKTLKGFQPDQVNQLLAVYGADGKVVGNICESVDGKYYINGKPDITYPSLQAAAGALFKGVGES